MLTLPSMHVRNARGSPNLSIDEARHAQPRWIARRSACTRRETMNDSGNTILITGGANGIGKALAMRFLKADNVVIVCDRDRERLDLAKQGTPGLVVLYSDVSVEAERVQLYEAVTREFPKTNVLINNAAIQRQVRIEASEPWAATRKELETNLDAPLHLTQLFVKHLARQHAPAVVLTTSGLAYVPRSAAPIYCAAK